MRAIFGRTGEASDGEGEAFDGARGHCCQLARAVATTAATNHHLFLFLGREILLASRKPSVGDASFPLEFALTKSTEEGWPHSFGPEDL